MFGLIFSVLWTILSSILIFTNFDDLVGWERLIALAFPLFGVFAIHASWRYWRRHRSLRIEEDGGTTWYAWIEIDGSARRSTRDPRKDWDEDGAGDGSGDGGGGD
jgi:hypothetical protein